MGPCAGDTYQPNIKSRHRAEHALNRPIAEKRFTKTFHGLAVQLYSIRLTPRHAHTVDAYGRAVDAVAQFQIVGRC